MTTFSFDRVKTSAGGGMPPSLPPTLPPGVTGGPGHPDAGKPRKAASLDLQRAIIAREMQQHGQVAESIAAGALAQAARAHKLQILDRRKVRGLWAAELHTFHAAYSAFLQAQEPEPMPAAAVSVETPRMVRYWRLEMVDGRQTIAYSSSDFNKGE